MVKSLVVVYIWLWHRAGRTKAMYFLNMVSIPHSESYVSSHSPYRYYICAFLIPHTLLLEEIFYSTKTEIFFFCHQKQIHVYNGCTNGQYSQDNEFSKSVIKVNQNLVHIPYFVIFPLTLFPTYISHQNYSRSLCICSSSIIHQPNFVPLVHHSGKNLGSIQTIRCWYKLIIRTDLSDWPRSPLGIFMLN